MSLGDLRQRHSSKWRRYPGDVLPMHVAEMDFEVAEPIRDLIIDFAKRSDLGYLGPLPELQTAFADFAFRRWNWKSEFVATRIATDVGVAAVELLRALCKPGDRVLINSPVYASFMKWLTELSLVPQDVPLIESNGEWRLDLQGIAEALDSGVRIVLLCNPQNPVGTVHSRSELEQLAKLAAEFGAIVISDEIHAPLCYASREFTPYLSAGEAASETGILITSNSKSWNTAGLKAAFLATESESISSRLSALPEAMHWRASLLGGFSMIASFRDGEPWLNQTVERIASNFALLTGFISSELSEARVWNERATYLAWISLGAFGLQDPASHLLKKAKVSVVPGNDHAPAKSANGHPTQGQKQFKESPDYGQYVRLNFGTEPEILLQGLEAIAKSLRDPR